MSAPVPSLVWFRVSSSGVVQALRVGGSSQRGAVLRAGDRFVGQLFPSGCERSAVWRLSRVPGGGWAFYAGGCSAFPAASCPLSASSGLGSRVFGCGVLLRPRGG